MIVDTHELMYACMFFFLVCSVLALELNTNRVEYERRARELVEKFAKGADRAVLRKVRVLFKVNKTVLWHTCSKPFKIVVQQFFNCLHDIQSIGSCSCININYLTSLLDSC